MSGFSTSFSVDRTPEDALLAITDVRRWWTGDIEGDAGAVGDEFVYRYAHLHYSKQRLTELVPARRAVWRVLEARLAFTADPGEWAGTDLVFDVVPDGEGANVRFTHQGLVPEFECYEQCSNAWGFFVHASLRRFLTTGEGPAAPSWA